MKLSELQVGPPLSQGGQGTIHVVLDAPERVLKRFHKARSNRIPLQPAHSALAPIDAKDVEIRGSSSV